MTQTEAPRVETLSSSNEASPAQSHVYSTPSANSSGASQGARSSPILHSALVPELEAPKPQAQSKTSVSCGTKRPVLDDIEDLDTNKKIKLGDSAEG